jgi:hypothetical protein
MDDTFLCAIIRSINEFAPGAVPLGDCAERRDQVTLLFGVFLLIGGLLALFAG